ncbi:TrkH family potassium uptake protein [Microbacterium imperiale]|uniref:Potassium transporter Trk n=1 Tax=Microbacterium imperiale TaxID=33884 RepID=A0A9W6M3Y4_9MICO|nr:TrkH family potassium uptake protein [Microbacterium imperiale]MBP2421305.1 Trk-type K+ transport system membrane component [Microbacterium imperiale]MDS0199585.1 TrkH family potassium uptake protein [Microbacterium imperiale]BFE41645.1 potassium transporter TrkG [Microbacterium imperiale]GLJ80595.1 potassium transporter Trk [Microbacterium imperiale]
MTGTGAVAINPATRVLRRGAGWVGDLTRRSPARAAIAIFVVAGLGFTLLLRLPAAAADGRATPWADAVFTAVSAITVTGLTSVDTAEHWSAYGKVVILLAIQTGGLGIVTVALLLARAVTRRLGLGSRLFAQQAIGAPQLGEVKDLLRIVVVTTFVIEGAIAIALAPSFITAEGWARGAWSSVFYAVSAFNNAGFSVHAGGVAAFGHHPGILIPLTVAVLIGSLGFPVYLNLLHARWTRKRWTLHTKLTLITTGILFVVGAAGWAVTEWGNRATIGDLPVAERVGNALFASAMMRSGGFAMIDPADSTSTTLLLTDALMFVGGGSVSTAGGIKVTTLAVLFLAIVAEARGVPHVTAAGRTIATGVLRVAISVTFLGATLVLGGAGLITLVSDAPLDRILFEVISAFATCGLSVGLSAELGPFGMYVLSALMLVGRVGPIALATSLSVRRRNIRFQLPEERPIVG